MVILNEITMDGQWPQQNSDDTELDLSIASPGDFDLVLEDLGGDEMDILFGFGADANMGNTSDADANATASEQDDNGNQRKAIWSRKRHNREQLLELEGSFRENQHPDGKHRAALGERLGITEPQVKFWFQNRRASKKARNLKHEMNEFKVVNEALQAERQSLKLATENNTCLTCGGPTVRVGANRKHLVSENERLKHELQRATAFLNRVSGGRAPELISSSMSSGSRGPVTAINHNVGAGKGLATDHAVPPPSHRAHAGCTSCGQRDTDNNTILISHSDRALAELRALVYSGTTMWIPTTDGEVLNFQKYTETMFPSIFGPYRTGSVVDGTRKAGDVQCTADNLVGVLMDAARWSEMFPGIVASATASPIVVTPSASQHGMIQVIDAELRVLSSRVSLRKIRFVRQCRKLQAGTWAVVDVSVDGILGQDNGSRLLPSGCLIEDRNNSCCKVTWIINMEYDETTVSPLYHPLIRSGQALGACRWHASLQRQCEYLAILHSYPVPGDTADMTPDGRKNIFEVAQRMTRSFYEAMCGPRDKPWRSVNGWSGGCSIGLERFELIARIVTFSTGSGAPGSVVLRATTTVWLPGIPAQQVFDYLCDGGHRGEWDSLANGEPVLQEGYFSTGQLPGNAVSVLRAIAPDGTNGKLIMQEARTDTSCMVLAYATLDDRSMHHAMTNGGPGSISLLPSGLVVLPDGHSESLEPPNSAACSSSTAVRHRSNSNTGSFVSVMYQTLLSGQPPVEPSLEAIDNAGNLLCRVIRKIKGAVDANSVIDA